MGTDLIHNLILDNLSPDNKTVFVIFFKLSLSYMAKRSVRSMQLSPGGSHFQSWKNHGKRDHKSPAMVHGRK